MGALPTVLATDPVAWRDTSTGMPYFDPSNSVYLRALQVYGGDFLQMTGISNEETAGDVLEALFGYAYDLECERNTAEMGRPWRCGLSVENAARYWRLIFQHAL